MDLSKVKQLTDWLKSTSKEKASISARIRVVDEISLGRCITTAEAVKKNELLLSVPNQFLLNYTTVLQHLSYSNNGIDQFLRKRILQFNNRVYATNADEITFLYSKLDCEKLLSLTSHQLLTLFICLERKRHESSFWYPLFSCFPELNEYKAIPMTWNLKIASEHHVKLFGLLPRSVLNHAKSQSNQFYSDIETIGSVLKEQDVILTESEYLWAWLAINTRCLYYKLPKYLPITEKTESEASNITLVPFVDFINHRCDESNCLARVSKSGYEVLATGNISIGTHLWFTYGPHNDEFLQSEYGFSTSKMTEKTWDYTSFNRYNTIDLSPIITKLLCSTTKKKIYTWLKQTRYYDDYTLGVENISSTKDGKVKISVKPSYRTRIALASLTERNEDFYYDSSQDNIECPSNLRKFYEGFNDGEYYKKTEAVLLDKILAKIKQEIGLKLEALSKLDTAGSVEHVAVENLLSNQKFLLNSFD